MQVDSPAPSLASRLLALAGRWAQPILLSGLLLLYLAVSARNLDVTPTVYEDEPWIASASWKLAQEGVLGSDLFEGFHGAEDHYLGFLPLFSLLQGATFAVTGETGLGSSRGVAVSLGFLVVVLTFTLARRLFGVEVALLAVALLLLCRLIGVTPSEVSGIPLMDITRIARFDILVPVLGITALHAGVSAEARRDPRLYACAGTLAGLASLSHIYGACWFAALVCLALFARPGWHCGLTLAGGFLLPWVPYAAWVVQHASDWSGQMSLYSGRFDLLEPNFYWSNAIEERRRYGPGLGPGWEGYVLRPGFWAGLIAIPASLIALLWTGVRRDDRAGRYVAVPVVVFVVLFGLLLNVKLVSYSIAFLPLVAIAGAEGCSRLWRWCAPGRGNQPLLRGVLVVAAVAVAAEGVGRIVALESAARRDTPYPVFVARVREELPADARILGHHRYWFGLEDLPYRSWAVPIFQGRYQEPPVEMRDSLDAIAPTVILFDDRIREYFAHQPEQYGIVRQWMADNGFMLLATVDDRTYGRMEIYATELDRPVGNGTIR